MKTVAFDIGGVLRPVYIDGSKERDWPVLRSLYCMFCASSEWKVVVTTSRPLSKSKFSDIHAEFDQLGLPRPEALHIAIDNHSKRGLYQSAKPDLVVDDRESCIREAVALGITTLKVD